MASRLGRRETWGRKVRYGEPMYRVSTHEPDWTMKGTSNSSNTVTWRARITICPSAAVSSTGSLFHTTQRPSEVCDAAIPPLNIHSSAQLRPAAHTAFRWLPLRYRTSSPSRSYLRSFSVPYGPTTGRLSAEGASRKAHLNACRRASVYNRRDRKQRTSAKNTATKQSAQLGPETVE